MRVKLESRLFGEHADPTAHSLLRIPDNDKLRDREALAQVLDAISEAHGQGDYRLKVSADASDDRRDSHARDLSMIIVGAEDKNEE